MIGLDKSEDMIKAASKDSHSHFHSLNILFVMVTNYNLGYQKLEMSENFDKVFSNAALH